MKIGAEAQLQQLEQRIQANASQIDAYLEQRVIILKNLVGLLARSIELDKDVMKTVAAYRQGMNFASDAARNEESLKIDQLFSRVGMSFEAYPELKSQQVILEVMRQNSYLQQEITAARALYNDAIFLWNQAIFQWPVKKIIAARRSYTTRIPFIASAAVKAQARDKFF